MRKKEIPCKECLVSMLCKQRLHKDIGGVVNLVLISECPRLADYFIFERRRGYNKRVQLARKYFGLERAGHVSAYGEVVATSIRLNEKQ